MDPSSRTSDNATSRVSPRQGRLTRVTKARSASCHGSSERGTSSETYPPGEKLCFNPFTPRIKTPQKGSQNTDLSRYLNSETCDRYNLMRDSPRTDSFKARELLQAHFKSKLSSDGNLKHLPNNCCSSNGRTKCTLADCIILVVKGDCGADHAALSPQHSDICAEKELFAQIFPLKTPFKMELPLGTSTSAESRALQSNRNARICITLQTPAGPLRLGKVE